MVDLTAELTHAAAAAVAADDDDDDDSSLIPEPVFPGFCQGVRKNDFSETSQFLEQDCDY